MAASMDITWATPCYEVIKFRRRLRHSGGYQL
jgi:hypothetical protein